MYRCDYCAASYSTAHEVYMHVERSDCRQRARERDLAIRLIVAQQWAIAITVVILGRYPDDPRYWDSRAWNFMRYLADPLGELSHQNNFAVLEHEIINGRRLPCAVDVLAALR